MNRRRARWFRLARRVRWFLLVLLLGGRGPSVAAAMGPDLVILLQPADASPALRRSLAHIRDELSSDRFRVVLAESSADADPGGVIGDAGHAPGDGTVIVLFGDPAAGQAELCLVRRAGGRAAVRRAMVVVDVPERLPEALAGQALELLRATALELSIEIQRATRPQVPSVSRSEVGGRPNAVPPPAAAPERRLFTAEMGLGIWNSIGGPTFAVAPVGRFALRLSEWGWARLSVSGLGSRPRLETAYGSALLSQAAALLEFVAVSRSGKRVRPMISLGAGLLNVAVVGDGAAPYEGREPGRWSGALDGGVGVAFAVGTRAALVSELHALVAAPHPVVRFVDTRAATIGYPSLILTLALQVAP